MDIRHTVSLILIAIGALLALMGAIAIFTPAGENLALRLGCGGTSVFGVLMVLMGLRLRNTAVAESPALKQMLEVQGETSRTEVAKPSFLKDKAATEAEPPEPKPAPPANPPRVATIYWVIAVAFTLTVLGLTVFVLDFVEEAQQVRMVAIVLAMLVTLLLPTMVLWGRRRGASSGSNEH